MDRNGLSYELSSWISKYCDSWKYDAENHCVHISGNMTIIDPKLERLPIDIHCNGLLKFKNCSRLISIEGIHTRVITHLAAHNNPAYLGVYYTENDKVEIGSTPRMKGLKFEDCALPEELYCSAYAQQFLPSNNLAKMSLEEYIEKNFEKILASPEQLESVALFFPHIAEKHRGRIMGSKFCF
jgi:hypothetical protein